MLHARVPSLLASVFTGASKGFVSQLFAARLSLGNCYRRRQIPAFKSLLTATLAPGALVWLLVCCRHQVATKSCHQPCKLPHACRRALVACWCAAVAPAAAQTFRALDDAELARRAEKARLRPGSRRPRRGPRRGAGEPLEAERAPWRSGLWEDARRARSRTR